MENKHIELLAEVTGLLESTIKEVNPNIRASNALSALQALETALTEKHNSELERLKRFDGSDDHPEHRCQRCTGRNLSCWFADNDEWNKVVGDDFGILCPNCFNELSALKGIQPTAWRLSREGDLPLADKLKERIYNLTEKHRAEMDVLKAHIKRLNSERDKEYKGYKFGKDENY